MKANLGIVLGFKLKNNNLTSVSKKRLETAIIFYQKGKIHKLLLSGGVVNKNRRSEAQAMYDYLVSKGLPKEVLIKEERSLDTFGNALFCKPIVKKLKSAKVVVFTSDYHLRRAKLIFKKIFGKGVALEFVRCGGWTIPLLLYVLSGFENEIYKITKLFLKSSKEGDEKSVRKKLFSLHPFYAKRPDKILKMSDDEWAKKLGVTTKEIAESRKFLNKYLNKL